MALVIPYHTSVFNASSVLEDIAFFSKKSSMLAASIDIIVNIMAIFAIPASFLIFLILA